MKKALLILLMGLMCGTDAAYAQDTTKAATAIVDTTNAKPKKFKVKKVIKLAGRKVKVGDVYGATDLYEEVLKNKPDQIKVAWDLANTYYISRDYEKAQQWFKYVLDQDAAKFPLARYWYAVMIKMNGDYFESKNQFNAFIKEYKGEDTKYKKWAKIDADGCDLAIRMGAKPDKINLTHFDKRINGPYSDISPVMVDDTTMLYSSLRTDTVIRVTLTDSAPVAEHMVHFYQATKNGAEYSQSTRFNKYDEPFKHVANGAFSPDRRRFYYTLCDEVNFEKMRCQIYVSEYKDDAWQPGEPLGPEVNDPFSTSTHPAVGTYKDKSEILYFVSDRRDGKGGLDIWYSIISANGKYNVAKNAGKINTDRDEATPYYDNTTGTLYFSSQGFPGFGGYDVFKTIGKMNKWTDPVNMGAPINNSTDDMYFRYNKNANSGFVVSNRVGIISLKSKTCCDDIFGFDHYSTVDLGVKVLVYDEALPDYPLSGVKLTLALRNYGGLNDDIMVNETISEDGKAGFFDINNNSQYKIIATKETYLNGSVEFETKDAVKSDTNSYKIYLKRLVKNKAYSIRNIYYDYNKSDIKEESKPNLDSVYQILIENPNITIELGSHTDSRGSDAYNEALSQKRAESCVAYLIAKGIPAGRITAKGYGESEPLDDCSKYAECPKEGEGDCPCHQMNRRTEFKIIGETAPVEYKDETSDKKKGKK